MIRTNRLFLSRESYFPVTFEDGGQKKKISLFFLFIKYG